MGSTYMPAPRGHLVLPSQEWGRSPAAGLTGECWYVPLHTPKPLRTSLGVMAVSPMGGDRDAVLLSSCSLHLALTQHSPGTMM